MPTVRVQIVEATGLHDNAKHYVEVRVNDQKAFTTPAIKGTSAQWNHTRDVPFQTDPEQTRMKFIIWQDKLARDKVVAYCSCPLAGFRRGLALPNLVPMTANKEGTAHSGVAHSVNLRLVLTALDFGSSPVGHHEPVVACAPEPCVVEQACAPITAHCEPEPCAPIIEHCEPSPCAPVMDHCDTYEQVYHPPQQYCEPVVVQRAVPRPAPLPEPVYVPPPAPAVVMVKVQDSRLEEELTRLESRVREQRAGHRMELEDAQRRVHDLEEVLATLRRRHDALTHREHDIEHAHHGHHGHHVVHHGHHGHHGHHVPHHAPVHHARKRYVVEEYLAYSDDEPIAGTVSTRSLRGSFADASRAPGVPSGVQRAASSTIDRAARSGTAARAPWNSNSTIAPSVTASTLRSAGGTGRAGAYGPVGGTVRSRY